MLVINMSMLITVWWCLGCCFASSEMCDVIYFLHFEQVFNFWWMSVEQVFSVFVIFVVKPISSYGYELVIHIRISVNHIRILVNHTYFFVIRIFFLFVRIFFLPVFYTCNVEISTILYSFKVII